jgi:uncharacterized protein YcfJ
MELTMAQRRRQPDKEAKVVGSFIGGGAGAAIGAALGGPFGAAVGAGLGALLTHLAVDEASRNGL